MTPEELTPKEQEEVNAALLRMADADPANWREYPPGMRYYVGPVWANDGTIDWREEEL